MLTTRVADVRLLGRRAIDALAQFGENNLFHRGVIPQLGFRSAVVYYNRVERFAGESKAFHRRVQVVSTINLIPSPLPPFLEWRLCT